MFRAGLWTGAPLWRLVIHDWSKLLPSELVPYVRKFYGEKPEARARREYRFLWIKAATMTGAGGWAERQKIRDAEAFRAGQLRDQIDDAFNRAWLKHQHRNPHHWQHWLLAEDNPSKRLETPQTSGQQRAFPLRMPEHFVREMVADWAGAGRAIAGTWELAAWWSKNRQNVILHPDTLQLVNELILGLGMKGHIDTVGHVEFSDNTGSGWSHA